jgi:hypothetical protein
VTAGGGIRDARGSNSSSMARKAYAYSALWSSVLLLLLLLLLLLGILPDHPLDRPVHVIPTPLLPSPTKDFP